jgi:hypothetical protein
MKPEQTAKLELYSAFPGSTGHGTDISMDRRISPPEGEVAFGSFNDQ